jgi:hypothetical protein
LILKVLFDFVDECLLSVEEGVFCPEEVCVGAGQVLVYVQLSAGAFEGLEEFDEHVHR